MKILALVLAGGNGTRLRPLTSEHAKPALRFAAGYRIIDFVLSNFVNSGILPIYVLAQYKPHSLIEHIRTAWAPWSRGKGHALSVVLPQSDGALTPVSGTAAAVSRNLHLIERHKPDLVAVFAADHVYRMDIRQMARFHQERGAEVSIAAAQVPIEKASAFGIMAVGPAGELHEFQEKPARPAPLPADPDHAYVSMGNYLFNPSVLVELLAEAGRHGDMDFGHDIMPQLPGRRSAWAYDFASNTVPGVQPCEERGYWRDIGTVEAYLAAQRDVLGPLPSFSLINTKWPIRGNGHRVPRGIAPPAAAALAGTSRFSAGAAGNAPLPERDHAGALGM